MVDRQRGRERERERERDAEKDHKKGHERIHLFYNSSAERMVSEETAGAIVTRGAGRMGEGVQQTLPAWCV